ncbi:MAG: TIGR01457 family HAD-type hydrolase [Gorillibacterium sp.]|nr:TIGR01457 family HAD-type hydrolase [Gorillibacterium sp.]
MPGFIIDLDGTLYAGTNPIAEAAPFIHYLQDHDYPYMFVTNNSSRRPEEVAHHLFQVTGIQANSEDILTSAQAAAKYINENILGRKVFMIGENGLAHALQNAGLHLVAGPEDKPEVVVQGIDRSFTYAKLAAACRCLWEGAVFIATNPDLQLPSEYGLTPGAGSLTAAIQAASQVKPVIIGKPSAIIMRYAIEHLGRKAEDIWVVGDNLATDIGGGVAANCKTAWIRSGVGAHLAADELIQATGINPEVTCSDLYQLSCIITARYGHV